MAQQTAVEWLEEQLTIETNFYAIYELIAQAKQMEKEQIVKAHNDFDVRGGEQYYTQTYTTRLQNETN